ncbi:TPA: hypothetical protein ON408_002033 [Enterococcus faecalis]|uniref:hypothetical protein n=1 Tax=Enterococcus faecalis TaxID=1351 RepID=UPI002223478B|nr:hypothetical protein [Enterococcus faecalis]UYY26342.1 hypothetical protein OLM01_14395 [Enterococcus faecalis]UYY42946.1 hypothetical protein OLL96_14420 [Enterococcus faecalis]HCR3187534.1 hypothetical protein [Enterococcus faecalis]HCR3673222.1 hypothetical protein [Enterococcus faecalis]
MSYEIIKSFKVDRKNLIIKATYQVSNVRDWNNRRITEVFEQQYDTIEEFESQLICWADNYLAGTAQFAPSMTFAKRVEWLHENGLTIDKHKYSDIDWKWFEVIDSSLTRKILSGEVKPKNVKIKKIS